jgi:hypothetical protein
MVKNNLEPHGLKDMIQPGQGDSVIGMVEIEVEQEPRGAPVMKIFGGGQDCRSLVKDGTASDRAKLCRAEDTRKDLKEVGNKHFGKDFVFNREKGDRTKLSNGRNRGNLRKGTHNTAPKGTKRRPEESIEDREAWRWGPMMGKVALHNSQDNPPWPGALEGSASVTAACSSAKEKGTSRPPCSTAES